MKEVLNVKEMKTCDDNTTNIFKVPSIVLMERAALKIVEYLEAVDLRDKTICVFAGSGNNGGDAICAARLLHLKGYSVQIYVTGNKKHFTDATKLQYEIAQAYQVQELDSLDEALACDVIIDGMLGIGLSRNLEGNLFKIVEAINEKNYELVLAIDIATGISADTGHVMGIALQCDATLTFSFLKIGQLCYPGALYCGKVFVEEIGITNESLLDFKGNCYCLDSLDLKKIPNRQIDGNKGTFGKVLIIAGSKNMAGASVFAAQAAYRTGCGMVKVFTPECNRMIVQSLVPEALVTTFDKYQEEDLLEAMKWADVIAIGPGLGVSNTSKSIVKSVLKNAAVPMIVDADALNIISENISQLLKPHTEMIVTPHIGEMSRLRNESSLFIKDHSLMVAQEFAREYNVICVLKDARTITSIPYNKTYINTSGNDGMAVAGSGDVLTGMIAGLVAQGLTPEIGAPLGVYLHGLAGDSAANEMGTYSVTATDIINHITNVMKKEV